MTKRYATPLLFKPFQQFLKLQSSAGLMLLGSVILALIWANSPFAASYEALWHTPLEIRFGSLHIDEPLHFWINDGLMAIFFLLVGLEIKRELLVGELSSARKALLPFLAAVGGMLAPAAIYALINWDNPLHLRGWGIPTVTDIAFALGILTLLGSRIPLGLKVFLTALAIVDDLGAILLIVLFYSGAIQWPFVGMMALIMLVLFALGRLWVDRPWPYLLFGLALWLCTLFSGLHATLAGVLLAIAIPARSRIVPAEFHEHAECILERFQGAGLPGDDYRAILGNDEHQASVQALANLCEEVQPPLQELEHKLHPWVSFGVLPLFALANAGIQLPMDNPAAMLGSGVLLGIVAGLFFGKPLGIILFSWIAVKLGWADLPQSVQWRQMLGAGILAGIGFTMSLFITALAFTLPEPIQQAKLGILLASLLAAAAGVIVLWRAANHQNTNGDESPPSAQGMDLPA